MQHIKVTFSLSLATFVILFNQEMEYTGNLWSFNIKFPENQDSTVLSKIVQLGAFTSGLLNLFALLPKNSSRKELKYNLDSGLKNEARSFIVVSVLNDAIKKINLSVKD